MATHTDNYQPPGQDNLYVTTADAWGRTPLLDNSTEVQATGLVRDLGTLAATLSRNDAAVSDAADAGNVDALCTAAEDLLIQHVEFARLYRSLLVTRTRSTRTPLGPERSSW